MTIWVIVIHLATVGGVPVLPNERPRGFMLKQECNSQIPEAKRRWEQLGMPPPEKISCEALQMDGGWK
jgi:hypothetical protein